MIDFPNSPINGQTYAVGNVLYVYSTSSQAWTNATLGGAVFESYDIMGGSPGQILYQTATNFTGFTGTGTNGQVLISTGGSSPAFVSDLTLTNLTVTSEVAVNATITNLRVAGTVLPNTTNIYDLGSSSTRFRTVFVNTGTGVDIGGLILGAGDTATSLLINGARAWTTASLTNLGQLSNTPGYLTSSTLGGFGVSSIQAGTGIAVNSATGIVTVTNIGVVSLAGSTYIGISAASGSNITLTNLGVQTITAGSGITASSATGTVIVSSTDTLLSVTNRGAITSNAVNITNSTVNNSGTTNSGALIVQGGVGIGGNLSANGFISEFAARVWSTATLTGNAQLQNTAGFITSGTLGTYGVSAIQAGTDTAVSTATGQVLIWNTGTLQSVTSRGATTPSAINITNTTVSTGTSSGALIVTGGAGFGDSVNIGSALRGVYINTGTVLGQTIYGAYSQAQLRISYPAVADWDHLVNSGGAYTITGAGTLTLGAPTVVVGNAVGGNILRLAATAGGTFNINTDILTGNMNVFTGMTTGAINIGGSGAGKVVVNFTTQAISTQTGALQIRGGVGISGDLFVNNTVNINGALAWTTATLTNLNQLTNGPGYLTSATLGTYGVSSVVAGADISVSGATGTVTISGTGTLQSITNRGAITSNAVTFSNVTQATSTSTAAVMIGGGIGANSAYFNTLKVDQATTFAGAVTFSGTATYILSTNTFWTDNILELHVPAGGVNAAWTTDDLRDIGLRFHYYTNATDTNAALVLANDTKYLEWYNAGAEGTSTFAGSSYGTFKTGNIVLASNTASVSTATGSLIVRGGVGVGGDLYAGSLWDQNSRVWTTGTLTSLGQLTNTPGYLTSGTLGLFGVAAIAAGVGVTITPSNGVGVVTVTNVGVVSLVGTPYIGISAASGTSISLTNLGVQTLTAGTDTAVSGSTGTITVWNTSTLQSITNRGAATSNAIQITNNSANNSGTSNSGALQVTGGAAVGGNLSVSGWVTSFGAAAWTTATLTNLNQLNNGPGYLTSATLGSFGVSAIFGTTYLGVSNSVGAVTLTNLGVQSFTAGSGISTSAATGTITVSSTDTLLSVTNRGAVSSNAISITNATVGSTNSGALSVTGGVAVGGSLYATALYDNTARVWTTATLTNNNQLTNGSGFLTSATLGLFGVSAIAAGSGISINPSTGVGLVTVTNIGVLSLASSPSIGVSAVTGASISFTNLGVQGVIGGAGVGVSSTTGTVTLSSTATLQLVTTNGNSTNNIVNITNSTVATASTSGALVVTGGVGIGGDLRIAGVIYGAVNVTGTISTASNIAAGGANQLLYQTAPGITGFIATPTIASTVLTWTGTNFSWVPGGTGSSTGTTSTFLIANVTAASSATNSGALIVQGGAAVAGNIYAGGLIYAGGNQVLTGVNLSSFGVTSFSGGTTGLTPSSATAGAVTLAGTLAVTNGGTGITSLTQGYIPFGQGTSGFGGSANLFWDGPNNRLGIGTATPSVTLDVAGATRIGGVNSQAIPASNGVGGALFTWNYGGGSAEVDIWNLYDNATSSFIFKQKTGASTFENVLSVTSTGVTTTGTFSARVPTFTGLTGYMYANAAGAVTASTTIPASAITGSISYANSLTNTLTINSSGSGSASGTTYNGAAAVTISYNSIGSPLASQLATGVAGSAANSIYSADTRNTNYTPGERSAGLFVDFKANTADLLADGGSYHGVLTFRAYGTSQTDFSGNAATQIAYTDNGNLWHRTSASSSTWGTYYKILDSNNIGGYAVTSFNTSLSGLTPSVAAQGAVTLAGTLGVASGGTGLTSLTANYIPYGNATSAYQSSSNLIFNGTSLGVGNSSPVGRVTSSGVSYSPAAWGTTAAFAGTGAYGGAISLINTGGTSDGFTMYLTGTPSQINFGYGTNGAGASAVASITSTGAFSAVTKSFLIDHPTKTGMKLRYGSLEGPENGVYVRGRLTDGNVIELPDYWTGLVDADSITVTLTPIGKHQKLYVEDISNNTVTVGNDNLLSKGINCFYTVWAERKDVDKLIVEY